MPPGKRVRPSGSSPPVPGVVLSFQDTYIADDHAAAPRTVYFPLPALLAAASTLAEGATAFAETGVYPSAPGAKDAVEEVFACADVETWVDPEEDPSTVAKAKEEQKTAAASLAAAVPAFCEWIRECAAAAGNDFVMVDVVVWEWEFEAPKEWPADARVPPPPSGPVMCLLLILASKWPGAGDVRAGEQTGGGVSVAAVPPTNLVIRIRHTG